MSAAPALPRLGELAAEGRDTGLYYVHKDTRGVGGSVYSYNPRTDAASRRKWARDGVQQFSAVAEYATSFVTLTHLGEFHDGPISRALIEHDTASARRLQQRLNRFVPDITAGDVCAVCMDAWVCRIKADPRARFLPCRPAHTRRWRGARGTCFRCRRWDRVHYRADRWLCDVCIKLVPGAATQSRSPRIRLFWQREPGKSLEHLHRHCLLEGPFIPQDLLSALAEAAGFGPVCWVERVRRGDLKLAGEGSTRGLGEYLSKTARTRVPSPLSRYFTKAAAEPDMFNALPKGVPRKRAPALPKEPSDWYVSAYRPAPPLAPAARDYWLLPERYLPSRAAPAARSPTVQVNMPFAVNTKILADLLVERDIKSNSKSNSQWLIEAGWSAKREGESSLEPPPGLRSPAPVRDAGALRVCPSPAGDTILSEPVSGALSCRERRAESAPPLHLILRRGNASRGRGPGP